MTTTQKPTFLRYIARALHPPWSQRTRILLLIFVVIVMSVSIVVLLITQRDTGDSTPAMKSSSPKVTTTPQKTTPVIKPSPAPATTPQPSWWQPSTGTLPWQWEISHAIDLSNSQDAGTSSQTYQGNTAAKPTVYDIDGFDNSAATVAAIHTIGARAICYIEVGALKSYRPDAAAFPTAAIGNGVPDYPNEKYLDITNPTLIALIKARVAMCHSKGFDGVEPDIDDSYAADTGFALSEKGEVAYLSQLSDYAHSLGLAWGLKNGGDGSDSTTFVTDMLSHSDYAVIEEPYYRNTIGYFYPSFSNAGKALFIAEYTNDTTSAAAFCPQALADHANAALFSVNLDGGARVACK